MALRGYGLLVGKITGFRKPEGDRPHWLLMVQPADPHHPAYRVALNVPNAQPDDHSEIEYHIVKLKPKLPLLARLQDYAKKGGTPNFLLADETKNLPRLSYETGEIFNLKSFPSEEKNHPKVGEKVTPQDLKPLQELLAEKAKAHTMVAVFGTGAPMDHRTGATPATGFTGVENVHMNQGSFNRTNGTLHYMENARAQDGGLIILEEGGATGVFIKFRTQTVHTDERGHPDITGIKGIDTHLPAVRAALPDPHSFFTRARKPRSLSAAAVAADTDQTPGAQNEQGYVFADFSPDDASGQYIPDDDSGTYKTPFVQAQSKGNTRGPVPTPSTYPVMQLSSVVGDNPPGYSDDGQTQSIAFDIIGDSGAPSQSKLTGYEMKVADLLAADAADAAPAFMFHVGDVVYFYGESAYYYSQFYDPFRAYPAPIFAIPGNHDGVTYDPSQVSLADFQSAFCAVAPGRWPGAGGILRSTMTQPGVYFTLEAPLVSIIGLYSNCGESLGWLDEQQLTFLYTELKRLNAKKRHGLPAVLLAIHHFPRWFPDQSRKDPTSEAIDAVFARAGFWPDAVICGHAHLYQRVVRQNAGASGNQDIPYIMSGAGGYGISPREELARNYMSSIGAQEAGNALGCVINESGYVRATVTSPAGGNPTINFEYRSVKPKSSQPDDVCRIDLVTCNILT